MHSVTLLDHGDSRISVKEGASIFVGRGHLGEYFYTIIQNREHCFVLFCFLWLSIYLEEALPLLEIILSHGKPQNSWTLLLYLASRELNRAWLSKESHQTFFDSSEIPGVELSFRWRVHAGVKWVLAISSLSIVDRTTVLPHSHWQPGGRHSCLRPEERNTWLWSPATMLLNFNEITSWPISRKARTSNGAQALRVCLSVPACCPALLHS